MTTTCEYVSINEPCAGAVGSLRYYRIYWETMRLLDVYRQDVGEGKNAEAAGAFARYVIWSGIKDLLVDNPSPGPLKSDPWLLYSNASELYHAACKLNPDARPIGALDSIHHKLNVIAGLLNSQLIHKQFTIGSHNIDPGSNGKCWIPPDGV